MAYYNANEVIKLTRRALGITQEELSFDICDVSTLSKIENGHYGVRRETYRKLMEKMGRITEMRYTVCLEQDGRLLEDRLELERAFKRYDYEAAEQYLQNMKANADENILTRQYIARAEALIDYYQKRITAEEMVERIDGAIRMTVPDYEKYLKCDKVFPFMKEELLALMSLGNVYCKMGENEHGMQMYESVLSCLNANYIGDPDRTTMLISVRNNIARAYAAEGKHIEALREIDACLCMCRKRDYSHLVAPLLVSKAHSYVRLVERKEWSEECLNEGKKFLRQAYCLATARTERELEKRIIEYYRQHLGKWK